MAREFKRVKNKLLYLTSIFYQQQFVLKEQIPFCATDVNRDREKNLSSQLWLPNERVRL